MSVLLLSLVFPVSAIGVFRNSTGYWSLDYNNTGVVDKTFQFGKAGDIPVVGDWNADGSSDAGVFRPTTGTWYLDTTGTGTVSSNFQFGKAEDIPVVGDWNADGSSDAGVFRPTTGTWYLDTTGTGTISSTFQFGKAEDIPVIGDWNGDGVYDAGVFRPSNGNWYLNYHKNTIADKTFQFGKEGDLPEVLQQPETVTVAPVATFISDKQSGTAPLTVTFTDQSTGTAPLNYAWDFNNDGIIDSTVRSPSHEYATAGTYTINLTVINTAGSHSEIKADYITVTPAPVPPVPQFEADPTTGTAPLTVSFTDESTNTPTSWNWEYKTGSGSWTRFGSGARNPSNVFAAGTYDIRLTASNAGGSGVESKSGYITVNPPVAPTAAFTSNKQSGTVPLTVAFTDQSAGTAPLTYAWDFNNDGTRDSTSQNPSFTYPAAGTYTVKLTVTNAYGNDAETKSGYITANPPVAPTAAFTSNKQSGTAPLTVKFTDQSTGTTPLTFAWDFNNDGTRDSTSQNPSFTYTAAGTYTVKLTVSNIAGSDEETKIGFITVSPAPVAPTAAFTADIQSGTLPLTVTFTDQSTGTAPLTYAWDFNNDGTRDSTIQSPTFTYTTAGTYTVKLTVTNVAGSDGETKIGYIAVTEVPVAPSAAFTSDKQTGYTPLTIRFTDQSAGTAPLSYEWDFNNDGIPDSTIRNPSFIYDTEGIFTVNLTVTNSLGSDTEIRTDYITVNPTIAPQAAFSADVQSGDAPLMVRFTDQSTGTTPLTYAWDFRNDGTTDSTIQSPTFTYITAGTYTVKLTVTNAAGSDIRTETDYITVTEPPVSATSGIALTFDDNTIDQWYAIRDILNRYNAHVTFFVSQYEDLDQDQIDKLKTLKADGNEIAFHGMYHTDAADYLNSHTVQQYIDYEIVPGINLMTNDGLTPVDFAYPNGSDDPEATLALEAYFGHIRDTHYTWDDAVYYQYGSNQAFIAGIGLDESYGHSLTEIYEGISTAKTEDKILIFYGHEPVPSNPGSYQTSYDRLDKVLKYVSDNNLKTFTISEIH